MKRRQVVQGLFGVPLLSYFPPTFANATSAHSNLVQTLIHTPRSDLQPWAVKEIRAGRLRKPLLIKALLSAGVSQIEPRPVGFKYHAVLMVDAARRLSLQSEGIASWIPLLWNLDYFKHSQARSKNLGGWTLESARDGLPALSTAPQLFTESMGAKQWQHADEAITRLARSGSMHQVFDLLLEWAVRDFHSIGHKAILLAGVWRCLEYSGWRESETILRGMVFALLADGGVPADDTSAEGHGWWTQDYPQNMALIGKIPDSAFRPGLDIQATTDLLGTLRTQSPRVSCEHATQQLVAGAPMQMVWDAVFLAASDAVMNRPNIPMLHCVTVSHALFSLWQRAANPQMRRMIPLQAISYVVQMKAQRRQGEWNGLDVLDYQADATPSDAKSGDYSQLGDAIGYAPDDVRAMIVKIPLERQWLSLKHQLNQWLLVKSNKAHDFKYGAAVLETMEWISPHWRTPYLAACSRLLMGSEMPDSVEAQNIETWLGDAFE